MGFRNIRLYKDANKKYTDCNFNPMKFLDSALIGVYAVIRLNNVFRYSMAPDKQYPCGASKVHLQHVFLWRNKKKLEMCPQYTDAPNVGYLTIKLQNSTWYKCLNLSLTGSCTYICTHIHIDRCTFVRTDPRTENRKNYMPPASSDAEA